MTEENKNHFFENFEAETWEGKSLRGHKFFFCQFNHLTIVPDNPDIRNDLYGTSFIGCSMQYLEAQGVCFDHISAQDCDFKQADFRGAKFNKSRMHKCDFTWSDFTDSDLKGLSGEGSDFKLSKIQNAKRFNVWDRDMVSELIRCKADGDSEVLMVAALVKNSLEFCWREWKTLAAMPQWQRVAEIIYRILNQYPSIQSVVDADLRGGIKCHQQS